MDAIVVVRNQWKKTYLFSPVNLLIEALEKLEAFKGTAAVATPPWH